MARPPHIRNEDHAERVMVARAAGIKTENIARGLGISVETLNTYYGEELKNGLDMANDAVSQTLFKMATSGLHPAATFFWLKTRAGWREVQQIEVTEAGVERIAGIINELGKE